MDDAERIPIDIGYEAAAEPGAADPQGAGRTTLRPDGTLVIDILVSPCTPVPSTESEILVCAAAPGGPLPGTLPPPESTTAMETMNEALGAKVGPLELGSMERGDGTQAFGMRVRF